MCWMNFETLKWDSCMKNPVYKQFQTVTAQKCEQIGFSFWELKYFKF